MSLKSIFLLAVAVVALYFTLILIMLSPLHGTQNAYYSGYMNHLSVRQVRSMKWCKKLRMRAPSSTNVIALVSYPGSGNTWLRYLLQQATGIMTGSIYMDNGLRAHGFPAENITDGSVLVVKTHESPPIEPDKFSSAILLIRNPRDAILADFNRLHKGHIGVAPKAAFSKKSNESQMKSDWAIHVGTQLSAWESLYQQWVGRFPGPIHVVFYELLVADTRQTLDGILRFINYTVTDVDMDCAMKYKEGIYRRRKKHEDFDPYTPEMYKTIELVKNRLLTNIKEYVRVMDSTDENYLDK